MSFQISPRKWTENDEETQIEWHCCYNTSNDLSSFPAGDAYVVKKCNVCKKKKKNVSKKKFHLRWKYYDTEIIVSWTRRSRHIPVKVVDRLSLPSHLPLLPVRRNKTPDNLTSFRGREIKKKKNTAHNTRHSRIVVYQWSLSLVHIIHYGTLHTIYNYRYVRVSTVVFSTCQRLCKAIVKTYLKEKKKRKFPSKK